MLDTIALTLTQPEFDVLDMDAFSPSARGFYQPPYYSLGKRGYISCVQNPTKTEFEQGIYKPRLTLTKRKARAGYHQSLRVEFSVPKMVYGNNFDEVTEQHIGQVITTLHSRLTSMGIRTTQQILRHASVSAIHYSKNIKLKDYTSCSMVLTELGKVDLNKRLDSNKVSFRNEGSAIHAHASSYQVTFYDKMHDIKQALSKGEKRAIERDYDIQRDLFHRLPKALQVLRLEVRLGNRAKIRALLQQLDITAELNFASLFNEDIAKRVLLHYWHSFTGDMAVLAMSRYAPEDIYSAMLAESEGTTKPAKLLQRLGMLKLVESIGMRGAKTLTCQHADAKTWQRIKKDVKDMDTLSSLKYSAIRDASGELADFKPLRIRGLETEMESWGRI
jgi:hypothetical protein